VQVVDYMKEMTTSLNHVIQPAFIHLDNNHALDQEQAGELKEFNEKTSEFFNFVINHLKNTTDQECEELDQRRDELLSMINEIQLKRIKILKKTQKGVKVSVTYMDMLNETKNLILNVVHLVKANVNMLTNAHQEPRDIDVEVLS
jgi:Na+/phosphate symporter